MKIVLFGISLIVIGLIFMNFTQPESNEFSSNPMAQIIEIPADVQEILDNSCFGCHNAKSKNLKGKRKLKFDKFNEYKTHKAIGKLLDISEVIAENEMPPAKILKKYPNMTLTDEQKEVLSTWAKETAKSLSGE